MSSTSPVNQNEISSDSSEEATSSVASDVSNPKQKLMRKKKYIKQENGEYKELDYLIYMAQFSAPEKTDQYYMEVTKKPQCSMSIYPRGCDKPMTQREELMLPSTFRERSFSLVLEQAEKSLEEWEKKSTDKK